MNLEPSTSSSKVSRLRRYHQMASVACFVATVVFQCTGASAFSTAAKTALVLSAVPISLCGVLSLACGRPGEEHRCFRSAQQLLQLAVVLVVHKGAADAHTAQQVVFVYLLVFADRLRFRHHLLRVFFTFACLVWAYPQPRSYVVACLANLDAFVFVLLQAALFRKDSRLDWLDSRLREPDVRTSQTRTAPLAKLPASPSPARHFFKRTRGDPRATEFLRLEGEKDYSAPDVEDCVVMKMTNFSEGPPKIKEPALRVEQACAQALDAHGKEPTLPQRCAQARERTSSLEDPASALCDLSRLQRSDSLDPKRPAQSQQQKQLSKQQ